MGGNASQALDGEGGCGPALPCDTGPHSTDSCTESHVQKDPWWRVDFGRVVTVVGLRVFGHRVSDKNLNGWQVRVGNFPSAPDNNPACVHQPSDPMTAVALKAPGASLPPRIYPPPFAHSFHNHNIASGACTAPALILVI